MKLLFAGLLLLLHIASSANAQEVTGVVSSVSDGDTFRIRELRIRLCGIDAPEDSKPGAAEATRFLELLIRNKKVRCIPVGGGTPCDTRSSVINRNRLVAQCFLGDQDIAAALIENGHACDWPKYSAGAYRKASCSK